MRKAFNIAALLACGVVSAVLAWLSVRYLGLENVRTALRYATAPALFLGGFAVTLLGKVHDLTEISGMPVHIIDKLTPLVRLIHIRLWILISLVALGTVGGWIVASVDSNYANVHVWISHGSTVCLALMLFVTIAEMFYLPMLHMDYSKFRMKAFRDYRDAQSREDTLKKLRG
jgi:hypothetical protein